MIIALDDGKEDDVKYQKSGCSQVPREWGNLGKNEGVCVVVNTSPIYAPANAEFHHNHLTASENANLYSTLYEV
jgi:hypothetical protein